MTQANSQPKYPVVDDGSDHSAVVVPSAESTFAAEVQQMLNEVHIGRGATESALFRVARAIINKTYVGNTVHSLATSEPVAFTSQNEFVEWVVERLEIARSTVMERLASYRRLQAIGCSDADAFRLMISWPGITKRLAEFIDFDDAGQVVGCKTDETIRLLGSVSDDADFKQKVKAGDVEPVRHALKKFAQEASLADKPKEISVTINDATGKNTITVSLNKATDAAQFSLETTERSHIEDENGEDHLVLRKQSFSIKIEGVGPVPEWVITRLSERLRVK